MIKPVLIISCALSCTQVLAAEQTEQAWIWDLVIASIVIAAAAASAALPIAAFRHWVKGWRFSAALPFFVLALWAGFVIIAKIDSPSSHRLWPLELFAWAMLNMIYMVALMTTKRIFEKADAENDKSA